MNGNFVLYEQQDEVVWEPGDGVLWKLLHVFNPKNRPEYAILQDNGLLLLKKSKGTIKWSSESISQC